MSPRRRFSLLALGTLALLVGLWVGLIRLGWPLLWFSFGGVQGPLALALGNGLWLLGEPIHEAVPWNASVIFFLT